ncbi:MAG: lysylphosphatidylglycerol synthase transmembrane domain-containing protein [Patescibacteria group bacterium]|nr:lysylphosphatidylglycerol synthase transmembrane domain-containing protein [Patescibacteria group bacterium]
MKKFLLFLTSLLIGIGLFIWILKTVGWQEIKNAFLGFTGWHGIAIFGLTLLIILIGNWKWKEILRGENIKISFRNLLNPYLAGFSVMFLAPILFWGGEIFRGYILKRNDIPWSKGMSSIIIDRILEWTINLIFILIGVLIFLFMIGLPPLKLGMIFGGVFLLFFIVIFLFYLKVFKRESIVEFFFRKLGLIKINQGSTVLEIEREIFDFFKFKRKLLLKVFGLSLLRVAIMYARTWFLILFLGKEISALPALSILGFTYLAAMIPIPTALGSHEAIQTFAFNSLGLGLSVATAFTMIIRGAELIIALIGVIILFRLGIILLKNTLFKKAEN